MAPVKVTTAALRFTNGSRVDNASWEGDGRLGRSAFRCIRCIRCTTSCFIARGVGVLVQRNGKERAAFPTEKPVIGGSRPPLAVSPPTSSHRRRGRERKKPRLATWPDQFEP